MTDSVDIAALAKLARLEVSDAELKKLEKEIPDILHFVEQIQAASVATGGEPQTPPLHNVMRARSLSARHQRGRATTSS